MSTARFAEVERLYYEAKRRPREERAVFLNQVCGGDDTLQREVESLLSLQTDADGFLSGSALEEAVRSNHQLWDVNTWPTIPGYTVKRVLGEGGMGVVYLAWQEKPFRRFVALKLIKPGMDTRQVVARFETERQALAVMDHPNIAAVFDAGSTQEGRPYFVMEFVEGSTITEYCDQKRLSTRDRLQLFVQVCAAVQHAHQKGVIHRDLKPSNVLVVEQDGHPLPKVIDFGTAKAIGGAWKATATQYGQGMVLGTLEYMSPEQAALSTDIDTATDVYSLGVLLYELLVGRLPFDTAELRAAGYDEIRRVIRESDPPKPSVRVEQRRDISVAAAQARQTDAPGLTRQLRGDLDWIVLKALEKDRNRRYLTAAAFATDIERFLEDQPVEARPPSSTYRIRKFTRRNRLAVAAVATIIAILSGALAVSIKLNWEKDVALGQAQAEKLKADAATIDAQRQREHAVSQQKKAEQSAAEANVAREETQIERTRASDAQRETDFLKYGTALGDIANDLRIGRLAQAKFRLLPIPESQRGWEWHHLFIQTEESAFSFSSAAPGCVSSATLPLATTALSLDADGESIRLRRCSTLERWRAPAFSSSSWTAPATTLQLLAENSRGQVLTVEPDSERPTYRLSLIDTAGISPTRDFGPFATRPICADISRDGKYVAVGLSPENAAAKAVSLEDAFEVWNTTTGRREFRQVAATPGLPAVRPGTSCKILFSPDSRRVATSGATIHVWDVATGAVQVSDWQQAGSFRQPMTFSRDSSRLVIGRATGSVDVLDLNESSPRATSLYTPDDVEDKPISNGSRATQLVRQGNREVVAVSLSPDDQTLVFGTATTVRIWDIKRSKLIQPLPQADVVDVVASGDGRVYSADAAGNIRIWPPSGAPALLRIPGSSEHSVPFGKNTDGSVIATATRDGQLTVIGMSDLQPQVIRKVTPGQLSSLVAVSPDGRHVFATESNGVIRRWTVESRDFIDISVDPTDIRFLTISPSGALLAVGHGRMVTLIDASAMTRLTEIQMDSPPMDAVFKDEVSLIISAGNGRDIQSVIRIWNWQTGRTSTPTEPSPAVGPTNTAWRLALSPDRRRLALISVSADTLSTVAIWDSELKTRITTLPPGDYHALAFSHDSRRIVTVGADERVVRVWDGDRFSSVLTLEDTDSHRGGVTFTRAGQIVAGRTGGGLTIWDSQIRRR